MRGDGPRLFPTFGPERSENFTEHDVEIRSDTCTQRKTVSKEDGVARCYRGQGLGILLSEDEGIRISRIRVLHSRWVYLYERVHTENTTPTHLNTQKYGGEIQD